MAAKRHFTFLLLFFTYFLDRGGISIAIIIFSTLIIPETSTFLDPTISASSRNLILGFLYASFPFMQFLGSPILGEISDRLGRRPILIISTLLTACSFFLSAMAIAISNLPLLFFSRLLGGLFAGNVAVAIASVTDLAKDPLRARLIAAFGMIGGVAWILFPFLGTFFSSSKYSFLTYETPFWIMGSAFLMCSILFFWKYEESLLEAKADRLRLSHSLENIAEIFKIHKLVTPFTLSILVIFAWMVSQGFLAPFLISKFHFSESQLGELFAYFSAFWFLGGLIANEWIFKKFSAEKSNVLPLFCVSFALCASAFITYKVELWVLMGMANFFQSISLASFFAIFPHLAPHNMQGRVYGLWNGLFALTTTVGPILAGWLSNVFLGLPFIVAACLTLISSLFYWNWYRKAF